MEKKNMTHKIERKKKKIFYSLFKYDATNEKIRH